MDWRAKANRTSLLGQHCAAHVHDAERADRDRATVHRHERAHAPGLVGAGEAVSAPSPSAPATGLRSLTAARIASRCFCAVGLSTKASATASTALLSVINRVSVIGAAS